jgi:hypothetical protein
MTVGNFTVCAGWQATAEARVACCNDEATCPMHKSDSRETASKRIVSQADADNCCASADDRSSVGPADTPFVMSSGLALMPTLSHVTTTVSPVLSRWRALVPLPTSPVPKHLLISVLVV